MITTSNFQLTPKNNLLKLEKMQEMVRHIDSERGTKEFLKAYPGQESWLGQILEVELGVSWVWNKPVKFREGFLISEQMGED